MKERRGPSFRNPGFLNQKRIDSFPNLDNSVFFLPIFHYQESLKPDFHMLFSSVFCALDLYIRTGIGLLVLTTLATSLTKFALFMLIPPSFRW